MSGYIWMNLFAFRLAAGNIVERANVAAVGDNSRFCAADAKIVPGLGVRANSRPSYAGEEVTLFSVWFVRRWHCRSPATPQRYGGSWQDSTQLA